MKTYNNDSKKNKGNADRVVTILDFNVLRRRLLRGGLGALGIALFGASAAAGSLKRGAKKSKPKSHVPAIGFSSVSASADDTLRVASGYMAQVLYAWGDPVSSGHDFKPDASNTAEEQSLQAGMHHSGMHFFPFVEKGKPSSTHGLLCINHEYTDDGLLHVDGMERWGADKAAKSKAAHGVSVVEVRLRGDTWKLVRPSQHARRITVSTLALISGPAAGSIPLVTPDNPTGHLCLGTLANGGQGATPWGTYLSCEGRFHGYFVSSDPAKLTAEHRRYSITSKGAGYRWHESDARFDLSLEPNEPHRFGWVVEIDPFDPGASPIKRTALGRFMHGSATTVLAKDARVVVYLSDGERFECIYKFVSFERYDARDRLGNLGLLDKGTLYVARFNEDGSGRWLELTHGKNGLTSKNGFSDQADVLVTTRQAADLVGATKMDRPAWIAVRPDTREVYCALTNNEARGAAGKPAAGGVNPRPQNVFGHILRWREAKGDAASQTFGWDVFALCGDPANSDENKRGNIHGDIFGSPAGLSIDGDGRLWIMTDAPPDLLNKGDYVVAGNNQMLCADVGTGEIRRFLTGPKGCTIAGAVVSPDGRSMFVNIQHPGEIGGGRSNPRKPKAVSSWPEGEKGERPRSATIVIRKNDGGVIGT